MGFDLDGRRPRTETGRYYRVSGYSWSPLWTFVTRLAADVLSPAAVAAGFANDGQYITGDQAREIALRVHRALADGTVDAHARKADAKARGFDRELVRGFKNFCRNSGGFHIH